MKNKFVFIGDSLTFGYGIKKASNWVSKIREYTSYDVINKGINGSTTTDMLDRFYQHVLIHKPNKVFIMGGTNDLLCNHPVYNIIENIELMLKDCIQNNVQVYIGIPPIIIPEDAEKLFMPSPNYNYCKQNLIILRENLIKLCNLYNCDYIDFYKLTLENLNYNIFFDGIHLNEIGQDLMFNFSKILFLDSNN